MTTLTTTFNQEELNTLLVALETRQSACDRHWERLIDQGDDDRAARWAEREERAEKLTRRLRNEWFKEMSNEG